MFGRRRDYYIGRPPRRARRIAVAVVAVLALAGATAVAAYVPVMGLGFGGSGSSPAAGTATDAPPTAATSPSTGPSSALETTTPPSSAPDGPLASPSLEPSGPPPCAAPAAIAPARVVSHGDFTKKSVALTFDDGTNPDNTNAILRILQREHVNATFFPHGRALERFPDVWRAVARAGFPIANHTYDHRALAGRCFDDQRAELAHAASIFETLGIPELPVMRPPYELWDANTTAAATAAGIGAIILWNVDTNDWAGATAASIRRTALSGGNGTIVLMHTFPEATAAALPGIIKGYRARGFTFVTIGQMLGIDGPVPYPPKP